VRSSDTSVPIGLLVRSSVCSCASAVTSGPRSDELRVPPRLASRGHRPNRHPRMGPTAGIEVTVITFAGVWPILLNTMAGVVATEPRLPKAARVRGLRRRRSAFWSSSCRPRPAWPTGCASVWPAGSSSRSSHTRLAVAGARPRARDHLCHRTDKAVGWPVHRRRPESTPASGWSHCHPTSLIDDDDHVG
jgi:hypothetical protein